MYRLTFNLSAAVAHLRVTWYDVLWCVLRCVSRAILPDAVLWSCAVVLHGISAGPISSTRRHRRMEDCSTLSRSVHALSTNVALRCEVKH